MTLDSATRAEVERHLHAKAKHVRSTHGGQMPRMAEVLYLDTLRAITDLSWDPGPALALLREERRDVPDASSPSRRIDGWIRILKTEQEALRSHRERLQRRQYIYARRRLRHKDSWGAGARRLGRRR